MNREWSNDDLQHFAAKDDLHVAPFREDGATYGTPTWIWSVAVDDALYVRAYNGRDSRWYKAAIIQGAGRIIAGGSIEEVAFTPVEDESVNNRVDAAYRMKYRRSAYLGAMIGPRARATTLKVTRRDLDGQLKEV